MLASLTLDVLSNQETYGEDTFHMSRLGLAYTMGMQVCGVM